MKKELDISINEFRIGKLNPRQTLAAIFKSVSNLNLWSYDAMKTLYVESIKMVCELFHNEKGNDKSLVNFNYLLKYTPKSRDKILQSIYNIILSDDGLAPLRGFGVSNIFGDNIKGDPERQSIVFTGEIQFLK